MDVVTFGEPMILMTPTKQGPLDAVRDFHKDLAGAESKEVEAALCTSTA